MLIWFWINAVVRCVFVFKGRGASFAGTLPLLCLHRGLLYHNDSVQTSEYVDSLSVVFDAFPVELLSLRGLLVCPR